MDERRLPANVFTARIWQRPTSPLGVSDDFRRRMRAIRKKIITITAVQRATE